MPKGKGNIWGARAFLIGVILAVVVGIVPAWDPASGPLALVLVILGIIIGLLNIGGSEMKEFLLAGVALVIVSALGGQTIFGIEFIGNILKSLVILFVPATIIVALKSVFAIAKS